MTKTLRIRLAPGEQPVCDFCDSAEVVKGYACRDYSIPVTNTQGQTVELGSTGRWTACETCAQLIDSGNRDELMARSLQIVYSQHPDWPKDGPVAEGLVKFVHDLHQGFWKGWAGRS
jgi:hypothetical protein